MTTVNVYLTFDDNCEAAFNFYKSVFGGEFSYIGRFGEMPPQEGIPALSEEQKEKIMHISLPISEETMLIGSDNHPMFDKPPVMGTNFSISVTPDSLDEAKRIFNALAVNGQITMAFDKMFWGAYFGSLIDQFGINWMVNLEVKDE